jgi:hypothetical protein
MFHESIENDSLASSTNEGNGCLAVNIGTDSVLLANGWVDSEHEALRFRFAVFVGGEKDAALGSTAIETITGSKC